MGGNNVSTAKRLLKACTVPKLNNVYAIGPFANKVSFGSQLHRAFALVWAFARVEAKRKKMGWKSKPPAKPLRGLKIAVIGGGISGHAAAIALAAFGTKPHLFDSGFADLAHFNSPNHRYIHPTINFWPMQPISPTTSLPLMNWFEDECPKVAEQIVSAWTEVHEHQQCIAELVPKATLTGLESVEAGAGGTKIKLAFAEGDRVKLKGNRPVPEYDLVFLATGFGEEEPVEHSDGGTYWQDDSVDAFRKDPDLKHLAVSGTGDGGLIDMLRFFFADFQAGRPPSALYTYLDDDDVKSIILDAEARAAERYAVLVDEASFSDPDPEQERLERKAISELLEEAYMEAASQAGEGAREDILGAAVRDKFVTLFGLDATAFTIGVSPIVKLLLAVLIRGERVKYIQSGGPIYARKDSEKRVLTYADRKAYDKDNSAWAIKVFTEADRYVSRHGPRTPISLLFTPEEARAIRRRQVFFDQFSWKIDTALDEIARNHRLPSLSFDPVRFATDHARKAWPYTATRFGGYVEITQDQQSVNAKRSNVRYGFMPLSGGAPTEARQLEQLFGICVSYDGDVSVSRAPDGGLS